MSNYVYEHIIAKTYGWNLDDIRDMCVFDFWMHLRICMISDGVEKEFKARLAGAEIDDDDLGPPEKDFVNENDDVSLDDLKVPNKSQHAGTIHKNKNQKLISFNRKVKPVNVNQAKEYVENLKKKYGE